ncbi:MAG: methionyl-tRNA formyltransferase [Microbacteriaceae bacterium]|jgi:methionyl-tRNA formyltransferase|nr:methionyl-tRNA formyltransferase [Microbacteriaceae bacterium]HOA86363.1 methionyl-tRNA formyltransferase [Microbacteriaceae bacterium]HPZ35286.1 methionyl-tRNA formyltransferase [Microbacteriaceae bacterium]HQC92598.1 methionyl-tRNA formyltransferase [Microbacteriaceae bacterium]
MRLVFAGTPAVAVPSLRRLAASHDVAGVLTRLDAPLGRRRVLTPSPVADAAAELGIPVHKANRLDDGATRFVADAGAELGVIVAYGGFVREPLLSLPRLGWINLHFSLLPAWRGAAPVQHALIAGDAVTGVSVFQLVEAMDAGDVFAMREYTPAADATAGRVLAELADTVGPEVLSGVVDSLAAGTAIATPQRGEPSLAPKLGAADGRVRWAEPAVAVLARIHGTTPEPGAHTRVDGARLKILEAFTPAPAAPAPALAPGRLALEGGELFVGTGTTAIGLRRVQPDGKGAMDAAAWWRGLRAERPEAEIWNPEHDERAR